MTIKLVAIDIDGTLLNSQHEITPEVFSAIQDAKKAGDQENTEVCEDVSGYNS